MNAHRTLSENIESLLAPDNLVKLENVIKSTYICSVALGNNHALLLTSSGFVYSLGSNEFGQLGNPSEQANAEASFKQDPCLVFGLMNLKVTEVFAGGNHSLVFAKKRDNTTPSF